VRDALPAGLFKGESKKTYDALYQRTRGAIVPRRITRATLSEVMDWAGVSHNTLKSHFRHLVRVGLVKVYYVRGDNMGAEYEVFTPEELQTTTHPPPPNHPTTHHPPTKFWVHPPPKIWWVVGGVNPFILKRLTGLTILLLILILSKLMMRLSPSSSSL
jgi:hypothetical protein